MRIILVLFLLFMSCNIKQDNSLDDSFFNEWLDKTEETIEKNLTEIDCKKKVKQRLFSIKKLRKKSLTHLRKKKQKLINDGDVFHVEELLYNVGPTYNFSFFAKDKKYLISFENDFIINDTILNNKKESLSFLLKNKQNICNDNFLLSKEKTTISIISIFKKRNKKIDLINQVIY